MKKKLLTTMTAIFVWLSGYAQTVVVNSNITTNTTWTNNNIYILSGGFIYVTNGATLTIQPGTIIKGDPVSPGTLVITRGAKIQAIGTPTQPIIMTSGQPAGQRAAGDWGGLLILGKAPINDPAGERLAEGGIDPVLGLYGGTDPNDNSGTLRYVRIEYAGVAYQPNNETNGLTLGGVGKGTIIDHVQVSYGGDDGFEWFGGNVDSKYLVVQATLDDMFDTDYGFTGRVQFVVGLSDSSIADVSTSNGFESDNDATGTLNTPRTHPIFSNVTVIGPKKDASTQINSFYGRALHLRRSTTTCVYNSVFTGFPRGLKIDGQNTANAAMDNTLQFRNNILAGCTQLLDSTPSNISGFPMQAWFNTWGNTGLPNSQDIMLTNPYNYQSPNFLPQSGSPLLSGADFTHPNVADTYFTPTTYRGAFGSVDWTKCWTNFNPQTEAYNSAPYTSSAPIVSITPSGSTTFCQGSSVILTAPAGGASYLWSNGETTHSITATASGNYSVMVTYMPGCVSSSNVVPVTVNPLPTPSITANGPTTICQGSSVTLTATNANAYQWSTGATTQSIVASIAGNYAVTVTDANGCTGSSANTVITVNPLPTASITPSGPTVFCTGGDVTLTANSANAYLWSNNATTQSIVVTTSGTFYVIITDANGCSSLPSNQISVSVSSSPPPTITASGSTNICQGEMVTLCASNSDSYSWSTGATTQCIVVGTTGNYNVTVTNANTCNGVGTSSNTSVTVNPLPTAGFTSNTSTQPNVSFTNSSTGATSYTWDFGDGSFSNLQNPSHIYATNGTYTVCLTATSASGCDDTYCDVISLNVNVNEIEPITSINLYPNPINTEAVLEFNLTDHTQVSIAMFDLTGKVVFSINEKFNAGLNAVSIDIRDVPSGIYYTKIATDNSNTMIKTVVLK